MNQAEFRKRMHDIMKLDPRISKVEAFRKVKRICELQKQGFKVPTVYK